MKAEDEQDVKAASLVKAEQDAELAEFNENIPLDEDVSVSICNSSCRIFYDSITFCNDELLSVRVSDVKI